MDKNHLKKILGVIALFATSWIITSCKSGETQKVEQWAVFEVTLAGPTAGNPYMDNTLEAKFTNGSKTVLVPGFYDGNGTYKIRFSPDQQGRWTYVTQSNQEELNDHDGSFQCVEPTDNNHGPVKIVNTYYLEYADGSPFYSVGTTAYQWTSVKQSIQDKTIETLKTAPFNKVRMCVFPKSYSYGNDTEPWMYPFNRKDSVNDFTQPNL